MINIWNLLSEICLIPTSRYYTTLKNKKSQFFCRYSADVKENANKF